jgi:hypothetical protein
MPYRNPGKKAFAAIIGMAAGVGVASYILFGLAAPEPGIEMPVYEQGVPPPRITTTSEDDESGQNNNTEAVEDTDITADRQ